MGTTMIRSLYDYHRWANRRLLDVTAALGEDVARRDLGKHWSFPTLKGLFAHVYGADWIWLSRWKGTSPTHVPGDGDVASLAELRARWDPFEKEQQAFVDALGDRDLEREVEYRNTSGKAFRLPLWSLLQHVANHATHHRSEIASMLTIVSGSPPATDLVVYQLARTKQG